MTWALAIRKPPAVESPPHEVPAILLPFSPQVKQVVEVAQVEAGFLRKKQVEALVGWGWVPSKKVLERAWNRDTKKSTGRASGHFGSNQLLWRCCKISGTFLMFQMFQVNCFFVWIMFPVEAVLVELPHFQAHSYGDIWKWLIETQFANSPTKVVVRNQHCLFWGYNGIYYKLLYIYNQQPISNIYIYIDIYMHRTLQTVGIATIVAIGYTKKNRPWWSDGALKILSPSRGHWANRSAQKRERRMSWTARQAWTGAIWGKTHGEGHKLQPTILWGYNGIYTCMYVCM